MSIAAAASFPSSTAITVEHVPVERIESPPAYTPGTLVCISAIDRDVASFTGQPKSVRQRRLLLSDCFHNLIGSNQQFST